MAVYRLNVCGEMCPIPILRTKVRLKGLNRGDILIVETDHSCTTQALVEAVHKMGHKAEVQSVDNGLWEIIIEKCH
ncbi:MAG: sulfurtransferase TusA family protein [Thermoanaerobacteraceae bacterium]|uniref:sulfurtransferase TusA family protein n=1 Tax=Thermanaeromonas sp. C210 TaxID=2731925 RepID=UPI00155B4597|nr:sulfurtransferase TusA family protein [Thermanaeromonas sp. C210]MBE3580639.1 sulfurtransferase TusA family protein [Thermoanaerobacteraceae bacterium]GFN24228.1 transcriptional regulator [Thermanaeromonas sp. C210]